MGKNKKDDTTTDQGNKKHRSKSAKLKKKHEAKKNKRKIKESRKLFKEQKKEKEKLKKLKLASESFSNKVSSEDLYNIKKILGKLISHNHQSLEELPQLFEMLDGGYEVDLTGLSDSYVMQKLNKVFKLMRLRRSENNKLEFKKKEKLHNFKLKPMIQHFIDQIVGDQKKQEESDNSDDDDDSDSYLSSSDDNKKKKRKKSASSHSDVSSSNEESKDSKPVVNKLEQLQSKLDQMQYKKVGDDSDDGEFGPKFENAGEDFLQTTLGLIDKKDEY